MTTQSMQEQVVEELAGRITGFLTERNGAVEESALVGRFHGFGRIRTLALRWLAQRGHVRRTRNSEGTTVIAYATTPEEVVRATAGLREVRKARLAAERREALRPTAEEYGTDTDSYRLYAEQLAAGTMGAGEVPFRVAPGREDCPTATRPRGWRDEAAPEERYTAAAQTARREREARDALSPRIRQLVERRAASGEAAWRTARAHYVAGLPTLPRKILHLLRRDGARTEASFLALAEEHPVPEKAVRDAVRDLGEAGKVRRVRCRKTGRRYVAPLQRMTQGELETLLIGVMADPRSGIPIPEDPKLVRRVEGFRKAQAERQREREAARREAKEAAEQPVDA